MNPPAPVTKTRAPDDGSEVPLVKGFSTKSDNCPAARARDRDLAIPSARHHRHGCRGRISLAGHLDVAEGPFAECELLAMMEIKRVRRKVFQFEMPDHAG